MRSIQILVAIVVFTSQCFAQCLTEEEIDAAIQAGMKKKKERHGLNLEDQTKNFLNAMANMNRPAYSYRQEKGFSINVFTPITWIRQMSANAAKEYRTFTRTDVTEEMKLPVMAVVVYGRKGKDYQEIFGESVQHVVIRNESRSMVIQPHSIDSFSDGQQNIFGASEEYIGKQAMFYLQDVTRLRKESPDGEFFITVIGEKSEKDFKIKKKHFDKMPMPQALELDLCNSPKESTEEEAESSE